MTCSRYVENLHYQAISSTDFELRKCKSALENVFPLRQLNELIRISGRCQLYCRLFNFTVKNYIMKREYSNKLKS